MQIRQVLIFDEEPVVVANCYRWEVNCIFVAENMSENEQSIYKELETC